VLDAAEEHTDRGSVALRVTYESEWGRGWGCDVPQGREEHAEISRAAFALTVRWREQCQVSWRVASRRTRTRLREDTIVRQAGGGVLTKLSDKRFSDTLRTPKTQSHTSDDDFALVDESNRL